MRHDRKRKLRIKLTKIAAWWMRQRVLPVALGVYIALMMFTYL